MIGTSTRRWLRVAGAAMLVAVSVPLAGGVSSASIGSDAEDRRITICHRTASQTNPYVVISPSKMSIVKDAGHDSHEGPVFPAEGADGKWGDIIPPFAYYASEKDRRAGGPVQQYAGSDNYASGGAAILANGCEVPGAPPGDQNPEGAIDGACVEESGDFVVTGSVEEGTGESTSFRLLITTPAGATSTMSVTDGQLESGIVIDAAAGSTVQLQFTRGQSGTWTNLDSAVTVQDCAPQTVAATGSISVVCDTDGGNNGLVTIGTLNSGTESGQYELRVTGGQTHKPVTAGQSYDVALGAVVTLVFVPTSGAERTLDSKTAPASCQGGTLDKTSSPTSGSNVAPGTTIDYSVTVTNTGQVALTDKQVVDTLPTHVTVSGTPSDSGVVSADGRTITWTVSLAPGASKTLTYTGMVAANAPDDAVLTNTVTFLGQTDTTTHTVVVVAVEGTRSSNPGAGNGGSGGSDTEVEGTKTGPGQQQLAATGVSSTWWTFLLGAGLLLVGGALVRGSRPAQGGNAS